MAYLRKKFHLDSVSDSISDNDEYEINNLIQETIIENKIITKKDKNIVKNNIKIQNKIKIDQELSDEYNQLVKKYWGYDSLKPTQFEIIKKVVEEKKDVCAILATGFGKSLCYQLPYLITKKNVIVISPLIALMHEQGQEMMSKGIPTAVFNSSTNSKKQYEEKTIITNGLAKLIFMTPEFFIKSQEFIESIEENLALVCIDEAHAVSTWGLDFRSSYTGLGVIKDWVSHVPILTLTATASVKVRQDISKILKLSDPEVIIGDFDRPNLLVKVQPRHSDIMDDIQILLEKYSGEYMIIYCKTRDDTDLVADRIRELGIPCESYHAGMGDKIRTVIQQNFIEGKIKCMCATIAFGMGINIPNVRLVIHYNCPKNIESYYQEIGRAGRDGKPSECVLFYSEKDFQINRFLVKDMVNPVQKAYQEDQIRQIEKYVYTTLCRRKMILYNFGQTIDSCPNCDNCLKAKTLNNKVFLIDYTCPIYLLLNILTKTNGKFGFGMCINVLLGKQSKVKDWMESWEEYGSGLSFGPSKNSDKEIWFKELNRYLLNEDLVIETQAMGMFFSTTSLTLKGKELRTKLITQYPKYLNLLMDTENQESKTYSQFQIKFPEIKSFNSTKNSTKTKSIIKNKNTNKTNKSSKVIQIDKSTNSIQTVRTKLSHILNSESDSD